jgi:hypothetical protein
MLPTSASPAHLADRGRQATLRQGHPSALGRRVSTSAHRYARIHSRKRGRIVDTVPAIATFAPICLSWHAIRTLPRALDPHMRAGANGQ